MSLSVGIVGLPNVGKSTLFKLLTKKNADIANYPFCTIEPNTGIVSVPDERLLALSKNFNSKKTVPAIVKFVDIAGLVKGASKGEGLGNKFLSHIKETDAILHTVRAFHNTEIIHTENTVNPARDIDIINTELMLRDLEQAERQIERLEKDARAGNKDAILESAALKEIKSFLDSERPVSDYLKENTEKLTENTLKFIIQSEFITAKPVIYVINSNIAEDAEEIKKHLAEKNQIFLILNIKEELELSELSDEEKQELEIKESVLPELIKKSYDILGLITFFTTGEDETRGWTCGADAKAPEAAGKIHTDFEKKFIKAEVVNWSELLLAGTYAKAKEKGLVRTEGKDYIVRDGDVVEIKHG